MCEAVEYVKIVVKYSVPTTDSQDPPETSKIEQTATLVPVPPIKVEVSRGVIDLGTPEFNDVVRDINQITIDFLSMEIAELCAIQNVVAAEIKMR